MHVTYCEALSPRVEWSCRITERSEGVLSVFPACSQDVGTSVVSCVAFLFSSCVQCCFPEGGWIRVGLRVFLRVRWGFIDSRRAGVGSDVRRCREVCGGGQGCRRSALLLLDG